MLFGEKEKNWEESVNLVNLTNVSILENVNKFPCYNKEISLPYTIIAIITEGNAEAIYDLRRVILNKNEVAIIPPNHTLKAIKTSNNYRSTLIVISRKFSDYIEKRLLKNHYAKFHTSPTFSINDEQLDEIMRICSVLKIIEENELNQRTEYLYNTLELLLSLLNHYQKDMEENYILWQKQSERIFAKFCDLLSEKYRAHRNVEYYANQLNITPKHFSKIVKTETNGTTATKYIAQYVCRNAEKILRSRPDLNIQEISDLLGFSEQSSFCRYFKRTTGVSPKAYLLRHK
ncbi:MAG: helix-turn-helix domain-containing protein [Bacteroidales bacterium]|nr:helix-turn-helix domain-containing protein [Bacteroidales bacterium]